MHLFNFFEPLYKPLLNHANFTFSLQMLVVLFASNIMIDIPENSNNYTQYNHVYKLFEQASLHLHIVTALYSLDGNEKLLKIFEYPSGSRAFHGPELNLQNCTLNTICFTLQVISTGVFRTLPNILRFEKVLDMPLLS